jgi:hypothetical protein
MREVRAVTDRTNNYDLLLACESESRERIQKALYEIELQRGNGVHCPSAITHILEGGKA